MDFGSVTNNNNNQNAPSSQQGEDEKKPLDQHLSLKVKGQDGNEVFFRIKRSTQLRKLMNAYCERQSVDINSIAFLFDGRRLRAEQTPAELEMEEGDEIDAMLHQTVLLMRPLSKYFGYILGDLRFLKPKAMVVGLYIQRFIKYLKELK